MKAKTFKDWKAKGRVVIKGEKSTKKNKKGEALFDFAQTTVYETPSNFLGEPYYGFDGFNDQGFGNGDYPLTAFDIGADF